MSSAAAEATNAPQARRAIARMRSFFIWVLLGVLVRRGDGVASQEVKMSIVPG